MFVVFGVRNEVTLLMHGQRIFICLLGGVGKDEEDQK